MFLTLNKCVYKAWLKLFNAMTSKVARKGQLGGLDNTVMTVAIVGITLAAGIYAVAQFNESINNTAVDSVLDSIMDTLGDVPTYIGMIVILALIGVVIFVVKRFNK